MSILFGDHAMLRQGLLSLYASPNRTAYHLNSAFTISTENGTLWAVAFSASAGRYLNTSLTVIFTLMFAWLWGLIAAATIYFVPHQFSRRRLVALVALRNSQDPWSALMAFAGFTTESMGLFRRRNHPPRAAPERPEQRRHPSVSTWQDTMFGLLLVLLALIVILTRVVMSIILPPSLEIGNVAPVVETVSFYPKAALTANSSSVYRAFRRTPALRALSNVQVSGSTIRERVRVREDPRVTTQDPSKPMYGLVYDYEISGVELGLKSAGDLVLSVTGECRTEYDWLNVQATSEVVSLFGNSSRNYTTYTDDSFLKRLPTADFFIPELAEYKKQYKNGTVSFAVVASLSLHHSRTENTVDPWYRTEPWKASAEPGRRPATDYRIMAGRPPLSCWHRDEWKSEGESVYGGANLDNLQPLGIKQVLKNVLGTVLLEPPPFTVGADTGSAAILSILSSRDSQVGIVDAGSSSIHQDMERLIMGGFILTLNSLTDATMYVPSPTEMTDYNLFYKLDKEKNTNYPLDGRGDFLVSSPDIATFNLAGLIATGAVVLFLLVGKLVLTAKLVFHTPNKSSAHPGARRAPHDLDPHQEADRFNDDRWARFRAFSAVHLLRNTYEDGTGKPEDDWRCSDDLPAPTDEKMLRLVRCHHGDEGCAGHIATDPELLLGIRAASRASIGGNGKRARASITSLPESMPYRPYDGGTGRTQTLSHAGSLPPGYTPVGQFEMRPLDEVNNHRASITSSNAGGHTVSETSYTSPSAYANVPPAGAVTPYSFTATPPTSYFSPAPSAGFGGDPSPYFSTRPSPPLMSPPTHPGGNANTSSVMMPYQDEDDIAISASASALPNTNTTPLLPTTVQSVGAPGPPPGMGFFPTGLR